MSWRGLSAASGTDRWVGAFLPLLLPLPPLTLVPPSLDSHSGPQPAEAVYTARRLQATKRAQNLVLAALGILWAGRSTQAALQICGAFVCEFPAWFHLVLAFPFLVFLRVKGEQSIVGNVRQCNVQLDDLLTRTC